MGTNEMIVMPSIGDVMRDKVRNALFDAIPIQTLTADSD